MPPAKKSPPPIDRPLSKAYLRQFAGWSTAYPPGMSEPNSLRIMENVWIDRNGAAEVRPGLRHLTYLESPDLDPAKTTDPGLTIGMPVVGAPELFYTNNGERALLFAVREPDRTVGFRVALFHTYDKVVHRLTDEEVGFAVPQGESVLAFSEATTFVKYLQINNRILALSDAGEPARMFLVGGQKLAKKLKAISVPEWNDESKLIVRHVEADWINQQSPTITTNIVLNPSFEIGTLFWSKSDTTRWSRYKDSALDHGEYCVKLESAPERTNMIPSPLHDVPGGYVGWHPGEGEPDLIAAGPYLQVSSTSEEDWFADGPRIVENVRSDGSYRVALDLDYDEGVVPLFRVTSYASNGAELGQFTVPIESAGGRWESLKFNASSGAVSLRLSLGGRGSGSVRFRNVVVCVDGEPTEMFHGGSGTDYYWVGDTGASASVYHPPQTIEIESQPYSVKENTEMAASIHVKSYGPTQSFVGFRHYEQDLSTYRQGTDFHGLSSFQETWTRIDGSALHGADVVSASLLFQVEDVERGEYVLVDGGMLEPGTYDTNPYFDGATPSTTTTVYSWQGLLTQNAHESPSEMRVWSTSTLPELETKTPDTLIASGGAEKNPYKMGFFYTFENEIGESAPSRIVERRMARPWSNWLWETPNEAGEPSGTYTDNEDLVADQLFVKMPQEVYEQAVAEGALRWNLYAFSWSDQEPVPVVAQLVDKRDIYTDLGTVGAQPLPYERGGWVNVTPARRAGVDDTLLPTAENRVNSSIPPTHRNGVVAGDRMILVGSPYDAATIAWSSNAAGEYTKFTPNRGGGRKTLTSGNLNLPYSVLLWQNPQSVDTLTILCSDDNGKSTSYYMAPATVTAQQTGLTGVMGFEETTATPGTVAPYAAEVLNNALYRPLDRSLTKSRASNYNVTHKTQTDMIANMWWLLESKQWMISSYLDNRLYYLVHNPEGELLLPDCKGNEIWVFDIAAEDGHWSRFLIQGSALKPITIGTRSYMSVSGPNGISYLDEEMLLDDTVQLDDRVIGEPIPWMFETNTQGANRAHDAWAHLQQANVNFGDWQGSVRYGVRGLSLNGKRVHVEKVFTDNDGPRSKAQAWDVEDFLLVRRDMKEWFFFASSLDGVPGTGKIGYVQYRYTPVSVNVGYEYGSIETFEYGADYNSSGTDYSRNGVPRNYVDYDRP